MIEKVARIIAIFKRLATKMMKKVRNNSFFAINFTMRV